MIEMMITKLRLLTESADRYIEDGSYLEQLCDDIRMAQEALEKWDEAYPDMEGEQ